MTFSGVGSNSDRIDRCDLKSVSTHANAYHGTRNEKKKKTKVLKKTQTKKKVCKYANEYGCITPLNKRSNTFSREPTLSKREEGVGGGGGVAYETTHSPYSCHELGKKWRMQD